MNDIIIEQKKLQEILYEYNETLNNTKLKYNNVYKLYKDYEEAEIQRLKLENKINILNKNIEKPYFARIDFENKNDHIKDICYIGKVGLINDDDKVVVVDWRSPISSLYYDSNIGNTSYMVDNDVINGNLLLKRQYNIENQRLISFNDVDTVSNDELLKPYLSVSADNRLKNIVATIQSEQNEIIRSSINKNLIIQGVAGSGKTTVALHRIAYLVYNNRDIIKNNQYMVIGPNKFFINYISSILPDLDVNDVYQYDLVEFTEKYTDERIKLKNGYTNISKLKSSLDFKKIIDEFLCEYNKKVLGESDLQVKDFKLIDNKIISDIWFTLDKRNYDSFDQKVDRIIFELDKYLNDNFSQITLKINEYFDKKLLDGDKIENVRKNRTNTLEEFKKNKNNILKSYFSKVFKKSTIIYKDFLKQLKIENYEFDNNLYYEDLSALLYINYKIHGSKEFKNIRHIVIDEAQDYNEFTFFSLKKILKKSTFSIYGDLAQNLYPYRSLNSWEDVKNNVFENMEIKYLNKSYRTSIEIMNEANKINRYLGLPIANAVIRHSDDVEYFKIKNLIYDLENKLKEFINKDLKSIAIITKDNNETIKIYDKLKDKYNLNIIDDHNQEYNGGICIITSKLSKGLEFDGVIISDVSNHKYNKNDILDMKLLYVSITRAMHNLCIMYKNDLCDILK